MKDYLKNISPLNTHPAIMSAFRITMSPHEWEWTQEEQEAMARCILDFAEALEEFTSFDIENFQFHEGNFYKSSTQGRVKYEGIDIFMGQMSHKFHSVTYNQTVHLLPEDLKNNFNKGDLCV